MPHRLKNAGFRLDAAFVYSLLNLSYDDESYSKGLSTIIKKFVGERGDVSASELNDWLNEFDRLNEAGRYFFSSNRYIFKAARPARQAS
jgi:arsenite methyltransferase